MLSLTIVPNLQTKLILEQIFAQQFVLASLNLVFHIDHLNLLLHFPRKTDPIPKAYREENENIISFSMHLFSNNIQPHKSVDSEDDLPIYKHQFDDTR